MSMIFDLFAIRPDKAQELISDPATIFDLLDSLEESTDRFSLRKAWHGLHFVFTGDIGGGEEPLNFLLMGGVPIGEEDIGYGPARVLDPSQVVGEFSGTGEKLRHGNVARSSG